MWIGSRCLPGRLVLSVSLIVKTNLSGSSCIKDVLSFAIVRVRCEVTSASSIVTFLVSCCNVSSLREGKSCRKRSTMPTSQMTVYRGREG